MGLNSQLTKVAAAIGPPRSTRRVMTEAISAYVAVPREIPATDTNSVMTATANDRAAFTLNNLSEQSAGINLQLAQLIAVQQSHIDTTTQNTQALIQNTSAKSGGSSVASTLGTAAGTFLGGGSLLSPIIGGLMSLFKGDGAGAHETTPLTSFSMPPAIQVDASITAPLSRPSLTTSAQSENRSNTQTNSTAPIQINVNALDSRSFLDHSDEIAAAVRRALLYSNSLTDVITDL